MKTAKPFVIEIKRNGRRTTRKEDNAPLWDPELLKSAAAKEGERLLDEIQPQMK